MRRKPLSVSGLDMGYGNSVIAPMRREGQCLSAGGRWEMLVGCRLTTKLQQMLPLSTHSSVLWFYLEALVLCTWGIQFPGERSDAGLALRADAQPGDCMGTVVTADPEVTLLVIAVGLWQGFSGQGRKELP